jgi:eukaryotic-like serine/threonine-protein kinase
MSARDHLGALIQLLQVSDAGERRALWRQGMATLARAALEQQPVPLEGLDPTQLLEAVRVAAGAELTGDLSWLSPAGAAAAFYELAAAIPHGPERRTLGRQVLQHLYEGNAETFVVLATSLAAESRRALTGGPMRARVGLALSLPIGCDVPSDRLALALLSRPDLCSEWLTEPAAGSLPARRLAARLLERAARECARRVAGGDSGSLRAFQEPSVLSAWQLLLGDRESLVWRHVAVARGILAEADPELAAEIESHLDPRLSPTEWRRAAVSLAAGIAHQPATALERCRALCAGPLPRSDPGLAGTMVFGLGRAAEAEPEAAEELLGELLRMGGLEGAEALVEVRRERIGDFGRAGAEYARRQLANWLESHPEGDDGRISLCEALVDELGPIGQREPTMRDQLDLAVSAFADRDALHAFELAQGILAAAEVRIAELELAGDADRASRQIGFRAMRELDVALLETAALGQLLAVGQNRKRPRQPAQPERDPAAVLDELHDRLGRWLLSAESSPLPSATPDHLMLRMRRMRSLLHLCDAGNDRGEDRNVPRRDRSLKIATALLSRAKHDPRSPLRRIVCAAVARSLDALIRDETCELSDAVVAATDHITSAGDQRILAEASMIADFQRCMHAYADLTETTEGARASGTKARAALDALDTLAQSLPWSSTLRVTALRRCLMQFTRELEATAAIGSLAEAAAHEPSCLSRFETSVASLSQLTLGARRRLSRGEPAPILGSAGSISVLQANIEQSMKGAVADLGEALAEVHDAIGLELPKGIADATDLVLDRLRALPRDRGGERQGSFAPPTPRDPPLPQWIPSRRILGGFYVMHPLGSGGVSSVFVVSRAEERHRDDATRFALKVPDYSAEAARTLSEQQFLTLFQGEAPALLGLPRHPNLASIVSFDAGAKPKPILVMELVSGLTVKRALERKELGVQRAIGLLSGIADGLLAMHRLGIAHLDVKPENVILRAPARDDAAPVPVPVLVDFGLAGRHLRPGCASLSYGAPEIWGKMPEGWEQQPMGADVYALACLAYEVLTGSRLFPGTTERGVIQAHAAHDGYPTKLQVWMQEPQLKGLCQLLASGLRQHPDERITAQELRDGLHALGPELAKLTWPLRSR